MTQNFLSLPLLSLPLLLGSHWVMARVLPRGLMQRHVALLALGVSASIGLGTGIFLSEPLAVVIYVWVVASCLAYAYFHIFNMALTARRIQLLIQSCEHSTAEPARAYRPEEMIELRLDRLRELGSVEERAGRLYARTGLLLGIAWVLERGRWLFYGRA